MIWFIFILIAVLFAAYAILPFFDRNFRNKRLPGGTGERENLILRKEEVITALSDLEYDFRMKKIGEPDYLQTKEKLTREAIDLMKRADELAAPAKTKAQTSDASRAKVKS
ncbi:hypothetical protein L0244_11690 [bacterium]|nr:hypothetical protein [bacterium]MCI0613640.1 hypothetical protein [bacterium]